MQQYRLLALNIAVRFVSNFNFFKKLKFFDIGKIWKFLCKVVQFKFFIN